MCCSGGVTAKFLYSEGLNDCSIRIIEYANDMADSLLRFKAGIFKALAHPTRIAIVEVLRDGEMPAGAILEQLGLEQANVSQHLAILRSKRIVVNRKDGNQVFYSLRDPVLIQILDIMRLYFETHLAEAKRMLCEMESEGKSR